MSEATQTSDSNVKNELFRIRKQLESLTELYIDRLVAGSEASHDSARFLQTILDALGDGLVVYDADEKIVLANQAAVRLAGSDMNQLTRGEWLQNYQFFRDAERKLPILEDERPYPIVVRERRMVQMEGLAIGPHLPPEGLWLRVNEAPIFDEKDNVVGVVALFQDITERKRLQTERDSLASLITHDLKNHLAAEGSVIELLSAEFEGNLDADQQELLSELADSNERYLGIANTLLEIYRTDLYATVSTRVATDVAELLDAAMRLNDRHAHQKNVQMKLNISETMPSIAGVPSALRQVFHNLIQNAVAASPAGGTVEIGLTKSPTHLTVTVTDRGNGMSEKQIDQLFDSTRAAFSIAKRSTSTGLGLYLCRLLIEAHNGSVSCKSAPDGGTTFSIELPLNNENVTARFHDPLIP